MGLFKLPQNTSWDKYDDEPGCGRMEGISITYNLLLVCGRQKCFYMAQTNDLVALPRAWMTVTCGTDDVVLERFWDICSARHVERRQRSLIAVLRKRCATVFAGGSILGSVPHGDWGAAWDELPTLSWFKRTSKRFLYLQLDCGCGLGWTIWPVHCCSLVACC